jgi:phosphatidylglycerol lysyltransferase
MTRSAAASVAGAAVFLIVLAALRFELRSIDAAALWTEIVAVPRDRLSSAAGLTALNYVALTGYDFIAFAYVGKRLARWRVMLTSFLSYAVANSLSLAMLSGASVRYRFYSRWGVTAEELSRIVFSYAVTFWLGLFALGGLSLLALPLPADSRLPGAELARAGGLVLLLLPLAYIAVTWVRRSPLRIRRFSLPVPTPRVALAQLVVSVVDWLLAGAVLFVLLPRDAVPFLRFIGAFLISILAGNISHVPGGLGVFEGLMLVLLRGCVDQKPLLAALVVYRAVYYLIPLAVATAILVADEAVRRRDAAVRAGRALARCAERYTPRALAIFTFVAGVVLLLSGATPAQQGRLLWIGELLPLGVIEASHFLASVAGAGLLVVSQGLARRLDGAYYLTAALMSVGIGTSLVKGFDFEEAALLAVALALLVRARGAFDRRAAFFETRFSAAWIASVLLALAASLWLGFFVFKHVEYSHDLWWQFELRGDASRFLRASGGARGLL